MSERLSGDATLSGSLSSEVSARLSGDAGLYNITAKKLSQITNVGPVSSGTGPGMITISTPGTRIHIGSLSAPVDGNTFGIQLGNVDYNADVTLYIPDSMQWNATNNSFPFSNTNVFWQFAS